MSPRFSISQGPLVLVNRNHPLPYEPGEDDLSPVDRRHPHILLQRQAAALLDQLLGAVGGRTAIVPVSGYRPRLEQQAIWEDALARHGRSFTETYVARPGCSEHQTGLAIDLGENRPPIDFLCPAFPDTGVCGAFRRRCAQFGFVLRYPEGREEITGIGHEPWHFRYVGWPHAWLMEGRGLVLEEYLSQLHAYPEQGPHLRFAIGGRHFEIFHVLQADLPGLEGRLPAGLPCQISGDNMDGVVVTLWRDA